MISHENYEKRSLNMEYSVSRVLIDLQKALENPDITRVVNIYAIQK